MLYAYNCVYDKERILNLECQRDVSFLCLPCIIFFFLSFFQGALYINDKNCRIVRQNLNFKEGLVYGIDCFLTPPSLGGRCDKKDIVEITVSV